MYFLLILKKTTHIYNVIIDVHKTLYEYPIANSPMSNTPRFIKAAKHFAFHNASFREFRNAFP